MRNKRIAKTMAKIYGDIFFLSIRLSVLAYFEFSSLSSSLFIRNNHANETPKI